jgi:hypothetical protein
MKIHFLINTLVEGGEERVLILIANYFHQNNHDVTNFTFNHPKAFKPNDGIKRIRLLGGKIKNLTIRSISNLSKLYFKKNNRPDFLIPFMTYSNFIGIIVINIFSIKVITSEHTNHLKKIDFIETITKKHLYYFTNVLTGLTSLIVTNTKRDV